ncbi:MAG: PQQ-binding-like beta-propeller repeat protein, partial [Verrucomicrobiota bacterium]
MKLLATLGALTILTISNASDWPSWRGPNHNGTIAGEGYPTSWTTESATWSVPMPGKGASCPTVWGDQIYITAPEEDQDVVIKYSTSGEKLWSTALGPATPGKHKTLGTSCNASPVTDGDAVFVYFKSGTLAALESDGAVRWKKNLVEDFGPQKLYWDQGCSPILQNNLLILPRLHGGDSWIAAFDKNSGDIAWKTERNIEAPAENDHGYSTPIPFKHADEDAFLVWCSDQLTAYTSKNGELIWSCGGFNEDA